MKFFKSFYFKLTLIICILYFPLSLTLEWSRESSHKGFFSTVIHNFNSVDSKILDFKFKLKKNKKGNKKIVIVAIDEKSLKELGRWQSWSRQNYAQTLAKVDEYGAQVVGFDIVFDSKDENKSSRMMKQLYGSYDDFHPKGSTKYKQAIEQAIQFSNTDWMLEQAVKGFNSDGKSAVLGYFINSGTVFRDQTFKDMPKTLKTILRSGIPFRPQDEVPLELKTTVIESGNNYKKLAKSSFNHGYFSMGPDTDGVVRNYQLFNSFFGNVFPSLALKMIEQYWKSPMYIEKLGESELLLLVMNGKKKSFEMPVSTNGKVRIHYYGKQNSFQTVSLSDVLNDESEIEVAYGKYKSSVDKKTLFKNSIVLIGATAIGIFDVRNTPKQVDLPGVEIHASIISQFLDNHFFKVLSDNSLFAVVLLKCLFLLLIAFVIFNFGAFSALGFVTCGVGTYFYLDYQLAFLDNKVVFQTPFLLISFLIFLILNSYKFLTEEREKNRIKNTFKNYVSADVVQDMIDNPGAIKLGGESKELTVLFTDIKGFSTISEKLTPEELSYVLNIYLTKMSEVIFKYGGTLDKFIGDAIMCFWGAPIMVEDHALLASQCALEMLEVEDEINEIIAHKGVVVYTRFGLNTGEMAVGNMGSETQFAYTALGDHVNLGARLEGINKNYGTQICVSEFTYAKIKNQFQCRMLDKVKVVGKKNAVLIFELIAPLDKIKDQDKMAVFEKSLLHYFNGEFKQSLDLLNESILSEDSAAIAFKKRCEHLIKLQPNDWNGVWTYKNK